MAIDVSQHLGLAMHWAKRYAGSAMSLDDAFGEACVGLMRAGGRFDPGRGVEFGTYATHHIRGQLQEAMRRTGAGGLTPSLRVAREDRPRRIAEMPAWLHARTESPATVAAERERARAVRVAIAMLPRRQRRVMVLTYWRGWADGRIAAELGVCPRSVGLYRKQAHSALRWLLRTFRRDVWHADRRPEDIGHQALRPQPARERPRG